MCTLETMSTSNARTKALHDPDLPALGVLLDDGVPPPLQAAVAASGARVERAVAAQVTWWPGKSVTVRYDAALSGPLSGRHQIVATSGRIPDGALVVADGASEVGVWRVPFDPALPGLAAVMDGAVAGRLLSDLGGGDGPVKTRLRAYRPGRRAVVEIAGAGSTVFAKVVPPADIRRIHGLHLDLGATLPVPQPLGLAEELGLVVLRTIPGRTLRRALNDRRAALPPAESIAAVLEHLPPQTAGRRTRSSIDRLDGFADLLVRLVPESASRISRIVDLVGPEDETEWVAAHGDFHEGQIMVDRKRITGLLDLDTSGWSRPGEDAATMLAHLATLRTSSPAGARVTAMAQALVRCWDRSLDAARLRRRVAAAIAALATGPFRVQRRGWADAVNRRLALAESWAESAHRVGEKGLITTSASPHPRHSS